MEVFEVVVALLLGGAALAALARQIGAPYPALVALGGVALAFIQGVPVLVLDPELALTLFVAPVLVDAAFDSSPRDLRANWKAVASLALGAVVLTIAAVAIVARALIPEIPWAAAIALGAIVAPPDAAAASTVLKQLSPPQRLLVILEGESLFNDASALIVYRLAVGTAVTGVLSGWSVLPTLLIVTLGSIVLGRVLSWIILQVNARIRDMATAVIVQFCTTFGVWLLAERLHLSGIITMVVFAMSAARRSPEILPARIRIPAWAVWEVAVFVLNVLAFVLVGFQLRFIKERAGAGMETRYLVFVAIVTVTVILARIAWVSGAAALSRWRFGPKKGGTRPSKDTVGLSVRGAAVVGWCGMRGTVTLAAGLALPAEFPQRDLILATAFGVTLSTLVLQGLTLRPLLLLLRLKDDGQLDWEIRFARLETLKSGLAAIECYPETETSALVRQSYEHQLRHAEQAFKSDGEGPNRIVMKSTVQAGSSVSKGDVQAPLSAVRVVIGAQRKRLIELRSNQSIGNAAFQRIEEEFDWMELGWVQLFRQE